MKKHLLNSLLYFLCIFSGAQTFAQQEKIQLEKLQLIVNNEQFITGESIFYKVILNPVSKSEIGLSKIVYVALIDSSYNVVRKQKYILNELTARGDIFLPTTYKTGNYKLVAYTNQTLNQNSETNAVQDLVIINPYNELKNYVAIDVQSQIKSKPVTTSFIPKKTFASREKVTFKTDYTKNNEFKIQTVSVKKLNNYFTSTPTNNYAKNNNAQISKNILPELRGEVYKGIIKLKEGIAPKNSMAEVGIMISIPSNQDFTFKNTKTNAKGEFYFILDEPNYLENIYLEVKEPYTNDFEIVMHPSEIDFSFLKFDKKISINAQQLENIKKNAIANQIENAYFELKKDTLKNQKTILPFYGTNAEVYNLKEFKQFNSIKEIIFEVLPNVYTKEIKGKRKIYLRDNSNLQSSDCLVLLNGFYIQDIDAFFEFNGKEVERVEFVKQQYAYGPFIYKGIINFITQSEIPDFYNKESVLLLKAERTVAPKLYYTQRYDSDFDYSKIPDYRTLLAWKTDFTNPNVSFYTSDVVGTFEVQVDALDANGNLVTLYDYFEVK